MVRSTLLASLLAASILATFLLATSATDATDYYRRFPFARTETAYISQAYNGESHQGSDYYALDFVIDGGAAGTVVAAAAGRVVDVRTNLDCDVVFGDYGNRVEVEITLPSGEVRRQLYAHLASVSVSGLTGVARGQKVGVEGDTGLTYAVYPTVPCGEHLHFRETTLQGSARKPEPMSGQSGFATGQTKTSDNYFAKADFSGNGCPDILGRNENYPYKLVYWPGNCDGNVGGGVFFGGGWDAYNLLFTPGDFSGDGCADIIARNSENHMWYWRGNCAGGFLGSGGWGAGGWGAYDRLLGPGDLNGNGCGDILGINSSGQMYRWYGNCNATVGTGVLLGGGWNSYAWVMGPGDFNGDGCADLIARQVGADPDMYWWRGNCAGGFYQAQPWGGGGWEDYHLIMGPWDFDAHGCADIIARYTSTDELYYWRGNCQAGASFAGEVGTGGWDNYNWLFSP